jgi:hypothetical protein
MRHPLIEGTVATGFASIRKAIASACNKSGGDYGRSQTILTTAGT